MNMMNVINSTIETSSVKPPHQPDVFSAKNIQIDPSIIRDDDVEIDVPHDGSCLFWAVVLNYLLPTLSDSNPDTFKLRFTRLFEQKNENSCQDVFKLLKTYNFNNEDIFLDDTFNQLVTGGFRNKICQYISINRKKFNSFVEGNKTLDTYLQQMESPQAWVSQLEIIAIRDYLNCHISIKNQCYAIDDNADREDIHINLVFLPGTTVKAAHYHYVINKNQIPNNLSYLPFIGIQELISKIDGLIINSNLNSSNIIEETRKNGLTRLLNEIHHYFDNPHKVTGAGYKGGLHCLQNQCGKVLLQIKCLLNNNRYLTDEEATLVHKGMTLGLQNYKINKAYSNICTGKKFIKAGLPLTPSQTNPIKEQSKKNIKTLKSGLKGASQSVLKMDEFELFKTLCSLPYKLQHATNKYYPAMNQGSLDSYCEIRRRDCTYVSPFSTKGNVVKLGNDGFVFFRLYVDPINNTQTRYGDTTITFDIELLFQHGWISLHDQLKPFSTPGATRFYFGKRLIRMAETCSIKNKTKDKSLDDGVKYRYRKAKIDHYKGTQDPQKSFGNGTRTICRKRSFLEEIFYGPDIILGIALSVIEELRYLEECGFRKDFLDKFGKSSPEKQKKLLGNLIKDLFRIEGKYPVSLRAHTNLNNLKSQQFTQIGQPIKYNQIGEIDNPDGDGRYLPDNTINKQAMNLALLKENRKNIVERLSITRRHRQKICNESKKLTQQITKLKQTGSKKSTKKKNSNELDQLKKKPEKLENNLKLKNQKISELEKQLSETDQTLNKDSEFRKKLLINLCKICNIPNTKETETFFVKVDTSKLDIINDYFIDLLERKLLTIVDLIELPNNKLLLISDCYYELILDSTISIEEIRPISDLDLDDMSNYNLEIALTIHDLTFTRLLNLYQNNYEKFERVTDIETLQKQCEEIAPNVNKEIFECAKKFDYDISIESIQSQLSTPERIIFNSSLKERTDFSDEGSTYSNESDGYDNVSDYDKSTSSDVSCNEENDFDWGGWQDIFVDMMDSINKSDITSYSTQASTVIDRLEEVSYSNQYYNDYFQNIVNRKVFLKELYGGFIADFLKTYK